MLDEPLSNLDAQLRQQARTELVRIHEIYKPTMIYVTHDQVEAMTVANRIVVLKDGELQQAGTPDSIYHHPANTFVAGFIGSPAMNIVSAFYSSGKIKIGNSLSDVPELGRSFWKAAPMSFSHQPEHLTPSAAGQIKGCISYQENTGNQRTLTVKTEAGETVFVTLPGNWQRW